MRGIFGRPLWQCRFHHNIVSARPLGVVCLFCERKGRDVRAVAAPNPTPSLRICDECLTICFDITLRDSFVKRIVSKSASRPYTL